MKRSFDYLGSRSQILGGVAQTARDAISFVRDLLQPSLDLPLRQLAISRQIQQVLLLAFQARQLGLQLLLEEPARGLLIIEHIGKASTDEREELRGEGELAVVVENGILDVLDAQVWLIADVPLASGAEEVEVGGSVRAHGSLNEQT